MSEIMVPRSFEYLAPTSVEEASKLLAEHKGDAKILAGGMSLIPLMKLRLASPQYIVDINRISGLDSLEESKDGKSLLIGAMTRHHTIESSPLVKAKARLLSETAGSIGDPQVRNLGTIGGALAHSDPSGDWGAAILAMRGTVDIFGSTGVRSVEIDDFLVDTFTTALLEDELITRIAVPLPREGGSGGAYLKLERKLGDFATVAVASQISLETSRTKEPTCSYAGIGLTAVGPKNIRARNAEECLVGRKMSKDAVAEAASAAAKECSPADDPLRGSSKYKRQMVEVFTRRAIEAAVSRADGRRG